MYSESLIRGNTKESLQLRENKKPLQSTQEAESETTICLSKFGRLSAPSLYPENGTRRWSNLTKQTKIF
jgi:hypothetical protein